MKKKECKKLYRINYSNCHEDASLLLSQVQNQNLTILSIASGLDNSLTLLKSNPQKIIAFDYNPTQIYLSKLKKAGIKYLSYEEFLLLLGITPGENKDVFNKLVPYLEKDVLDYFQTNSDLIFKDKLYQCGRFEKYFKIFRAKVLPLIHSKKRIEKFMSFETIEEQVDYYNKTFNSIRFKLLFKVFFSSFVMKRLGRSKEYFKYNKGGLAKQLKDLFEKGIQNNLNKENPYLQYILFEQIKTLPNYLKQDEFDLIKDRIDRLEIVQGSLLDILKNDLKYDFMNLSDLFEYIPTEKMIEYENIIACRLNPSSRVVFWNMKNKREFSYRFKEITPKNYHDLAFYYQAFHVYEVKK